MTGSSRLLHGTGNFSSFHRATFHPKYNNNKNIDIEAKNKLILNILLLYNWRIYNKILDFFPKYLHNSEQRKKPQLSYSFKQNLYLTTSNEDHYSFPNKVKAGYFGFILLCRAWHVFWNMNTSCKCIWWQQHSEWLAVPAILLWAPLCSSQELIPFYSEHKIFGLCCFL